MASSFESVADLLPEPMALVSASGRVEAVNRSLAALVGTPKAALVGRSLEDTGWSTPDGFAVYLRRCAATRDFLLGAATFQPPGGPPAAYRCEGALYAPRTEAQPALVILRLVPKESSSARFVALTQKLAQLAEEVARRVRAEQEAREQQELLHVTLSSIGDGVIATDSTGRVTFLNGVAEQLTGWTREAATGRRLHEIFVIVNEESREPVEDPVAKVLATRRIVGMANHTVLLARDGIERPIDDSGAPIIDASGEILGVVLVFRDVTEVRAAERRQAEAKRAAELANRMKDAFLATLSHELRTPLNAIMGWTHMLLRADVPEARRAHGLTVIQRNAEMQVRLIEDLLDVSRIAAGRLRLHDELVDLRQVIGLALDAVRPAVENRRLHLVARVATMNAVRGDAARLQQVVWNVLTNAVKFTPPGGTVTVSAADEGADARIVVSDSGVGFDTAFTPHVFDAFSQADASLARAHGGLGLGLTIARQLLEAHGGSISAESPGVGQGATFTITLPSSHQRLPAAQTPRSSIEDLRGCRVLVVDDDVDASGVTTTMLEAAGAAVVTCASAREALQRLDELPFDVLLVDIGLPQDGGLYLIQQVRSGAAPEHRTLPAIAVTPYASLRDRQAALFAGYNDHVAEPIEPDLLLKSIWRVRARATENPAS